MGHAVFSGTSWQCFTMFCDIQQELIILAGTDKCLTSLKMNSIHFEGRPSLQTTKKTFDSPHYMPCLCWHSIHLVPSSGVDATPWGTHVEKKIQLSKTCNDIPLFKFLGFNKFLVRIQSIFSTLDKQRICVNTQLKWNVCVPKSNSNDQYAITCDVIAYHLVHFVSIWVINKCQSGIDFFFTSKRSI